MFFSALRAVNRSGVAYFSSMAGPKIAVVLSGCGVYDGTEVHEAAAALAAITRNGGETLIYAPNKNQAHVIDHSAGTEMEQARSVMVESARIARGAVLPLSDLSPGSVDAVVIPGGFGAAKNLSDFGFKGADMSVDAEMERVIKDFHIAGKPMALCCIAPIVAARVLGKTGPTLTLGNCGPEDQWPYQGSIEAAKSFGANMELKNIDEICVDSTNKLVSAPAYMFNGKFHEVQDSVTNMVNALFKML